MMEEYPVKDRPLRMPGTIDSRHSRRKASRTGPPSRIRLNLRSQRYKSSIASHFVFNNVRDHSARQNEGRIQNCAQIRAGEPIDNVVEMLLAEMGID